MSVWLSLLIFNPLEVMVLFWAVTGDYKMVFKKCNIKHFYIVGSINFVFQYLSELVPTGIFYLISQYFINIVVIAIISYFYLIKNKVVTKFVNCLFSSIFNLITIMIIISFYSLIFDKFLQVQHIELLLEIIVNLVIRIFQFLLLYNIFTFWRIQNEKYLKKI